MFQQMRKSGWERGIAQSVPKKEGATGDNRFSISAVGRLGRRAACGGNVEWKKEFKRLTRSRNGLKKTANSSER